MLDASLIVSILAAVIAGASAAFAFRSEREARRANDIAVLDFLREYRAAEPSRRYVFRELAREQPSPLRIADLPDEPREHAFTVCHYLDHLGFLVDHRIVDQEGVAGLLGESVLRAWEVLAPYIRSERDARGTDYAAYFEDLAERIRRLDPASKRKQLLRVSTDIELLPPQTDHRDRTRGAD
jgi:hypothetical protein